VPPGHWAPAGHGPPASQPWWPPPPEHPQATTAVVLGIIGVVVLPLVAPFAWAIGAKAVREIDASRGALGGRQNAQIGYVLGIVGTVILGLALLIILAVIGLFGLALLGSSSGGSGVETWVGA
jgi:small-conductance mechanosensitive channel